MPSPTNDLWKKSATEVVSLLKKKELSPNEVLNENLKRIKATHNSINAVVTLCEERARNQIKNLNPEQENQSGYLYGLPVVIKDLTDVKDVKTTYGSKIYKDHIPEKSDFLVERIEKMGGVIIGKTNTPEFGAGSQTFNEVFGYTTNPWNTNYTSGGSSGGTASALAAGAAWLGTGSDLGGSLRNPASFCGVVGFRTTPGTIAHGPQNLPFNDLSVDGPMARTVEDIALFLDTMTGIDDRDPLSSLPKDKPYQNFINENEQKLNIGISDDFGILACAPDVRESINHAEKILLEMGHNVERVYPDLSDSENTFQTLRAHMLATDKRELYVKYKDILKEDLRLNIEKGFNLTEKQISKANIARGQIIKNTNSFFQNYDFLIAPSSMVSPFNINKHWPKKVEDKTFDNYVSWLMTAATISLTGCPSLAVPCSNTNDSLPIGIQIIGKRRNEGKVLNLGHNFQRYSNNYNITPLEPN
jgi:amidase